MITSILKNSFALFIVMAISIDGISQKRWINGYLKDSVTLFSIADGTITNATTQKAVKTDNNGFFKMEASPNDFIYAAAKKYHFDTLKYNFLFTDTITIFLSFSGNVLPSVTVKGQYNRYQLDNIERKKDFDASMSNNSKTLSGAHPSGFGLTFNLDKILSKKYRNQKTDERVFNSIEKNAYTDYRFSPNLVAYYTGYKGEKLRKFLKFSSPSYEWLRQHPSNEDVLYYVNDKLKEYKK